MLPDNSFQLKGLTLRSLIGLTVGSNACDICPNPLQLPALLHVRLGFAFDPIRRAPLAIARLFALRHDAFKAELAGVIEYIDAVRLYMLVQPQSMTRWAAGFFPVGPGTISGEKQGS